MKKSEHITYGGQAVLEGVMIRGSRSASVAVRKPDGSISVRNLPISTLYSGPFRRIPFARGVLVMAEGYS